MLRSLLCLSIVLALSITACHFKDKPAPVCAPKDAGVVSTTDAGGDAGTTDAGDAGTPDDAGTTDDAGTVDAGTTDDAGVDAGVDGGADAGDAGFDPCADLPDAGACVNILCNTNVDCCEGTTCLLNEPPTCPYCDLSPVSDCNSSSPCPQTQSTCLQIGGPDAGCACPNGQKNVCAPTCVTNGCPADTICNRFTQLCDPLPCSQGYVCPDYTFCDPNASGPSHGCIARPCVDSADCFGQICVNSLCQAFKGTCQY